ncbi:hypothetical protein BABINDRAFT_30629 [Babjeviella inositovora NRRL Y-12698]|uniref:Catalase n=1 Tax=Babjeviella inositovora NRRL Y-12698 TaxID=984486 RepID=A0A1E3QY42_9ASCO|nr:uncharacterized protein BABINDRAFT_30629 [Babjeviella inositovora NRRL Y-12698]ODQ82580.1 hypothetical protein BABINDRAFT_30629 [Babjeviella inositovora NRRL Y-12698]
MSGPIYTNSQGAPIPEPFATQRVGQHGPLLLQDFNLLDSIAHFDRERIPERVVHAHGSGAFGYFEVTDDITDICSSKFLNTIGKKTRTFTRFSTVGGEKGSADTARDPRGFATKFYTEEGNLDWVYNNTPVFFIRNPSKFPHFIHTQKRNPHTNLKDANMAWDYWTANPECNHQLVHLFSDRGTPFSLRHMNGYSGHTYKWSNAKGEWHYVQVHLVTDQGSKTLSAEEATKLAGENPDYCQQDLFENIAKGNFPSWTVYIQTMTEAQAAQQKFSVFDLTKVWPHGDFPLRRFGKLVLNENPRNYFAEVEQSAFSPSHTVPGQEPSADPVLQSRLFSYPDTHRHRLGTNYALIPVNAPINKPFHPHIRDGAMSVDGNLGSHPNYLAYDHPVTFRAEVLLQENQEVWSGPALPYHWTVTDDYDYVQAGNLWKVLARYDNQQANLIKNLAGSISSCRKPIRERAFALWGKVDKEIESRLKKAVADILGDDNKL